MITNGREMSPDSVPGSGSSRRRLLRHLVRTCGALGAASALAGCGGGSGSGNGGATAVDDASGANGGGASETGANTPPRSGSFGGGQGRILFVEGGSYPKSVMQMDLATRTVTTLVKPIVTGLGKLQGGVSRANDGSFIVTDMDNGHISAWILHFGANGVPLRTHNTRADFLTSACIAPDGRQFAYAKPEMIADDSAGSSRTDYELRVFLVDVATDAVTSGIVMDRDAYRASGSDLSEQTVWAPDGTLYVICRKGIYRVDRATAAVTLVTALDLVSGFYGAMASQDSQSIWFHMNQGNPGGETIWSVNVASGQLTRRSIRSVRGQQLAPAFSPDGQWLLMQQTELTILLTTYYWVCALRIADQAYDAQELEARVFDVAGEGFTANGRMAWF